MIKTAVRGADQVLDIARTAYLKRVTRGAVREVDEALAGGATHAGNALAKYGVSAKEAAHAASGVQRFRGTAIDLVAKTRVSNGIGGRLLGIRQTGRGRWGPDFYNPRTRTSWDITKKPHVQAHVQKYVWFPRYAFPSAIRLIGLVYQ